MTRISHLVGLAFAATAVPALAFAQAAAPSGNVARGGQLYAQNGCYECHGRAAQGARPTGPRLARTAMPYDAFLQQLRHPADEMPPYTGVVMPDQDVADVYAYVKSLPEPPKLADIPLLQR